MSASFTSSFFNVLCSLKLRPVLPRAPCIPCARMLWLLLQLLLLIGFYLLRSLVFAVLRFPSDPVGVGVGLDWVALLRLIFGAGVRR